VKSVHREIRWLKRRRSARVGLEAANAVSLARGLRRLGYSVDLYETRQLSKFLAVRRNKTDAGDANGIAEAGRLGASLVSKVHLKSLECQTLQSRLMIRRHLIRQRAASVSLLCRQIELFGGRVRRSTTSMRLREKVEAEIKKLWASSPFTLELNYLLDHCERLVAYQYAIDRELKHLASGNDVCRRLMEIPGVGPICALTFYAAVEDPSRFRHSTDVGAYFGLTPKVHQSGLTLRFGRISRMGNTAMRTLLVQSSIGFMRWSSPGSELRDWATAIERRRGRGRAGVALARKLAVLMLSMWKNDQVYVAACPRPGG
jgi:transposase